ncbi:hypothetical protein SELMODRAFT_414686 [Selaginella moellendorffii]|uniref:Uncharacterized protein n=1 Tax=Selaginella moellendorffii TaxID=88036 RepID=D8RTL0_SELML|nr:hypothetical protein SELMODRAFT_414686 [Selaginella moellendorffii]
MEIHAKEALAQYLFQVNKIEQEGFDTYAETRDAIFCNGALELGDAVQSDSRLEAVRCLHKSLRAMFPPLEGDDDQAHHGIVIPKLSVPKILEAHGELMRSTKPKIAARLRKDPHEIAYTRMVTGGLHVFTWPTQVESSLEELVEDANRELEEMFPASQEESLISVGQTEDLLKEEEPPFVDKRAYYECFARAQEKHEFPLMEGSIDKYCVTEEALAEFKVYPPSDLAALVIEGVYVGWKRMFASLPS